MHGDDISIEDWEVQSSVDTHRCITVTNMGLYENLVCDGETMPAICEAGKCGYVVTGAMLSNSSNYYLVLGFDLVI